MPRVPSAERAAAEVTAAKAEVALKAEALDDAVKEAEAREAKMKAKHSASVKALSAEYEALVLELTEAAEAGSGDGDASSAECSEPMGSAQVGGVSHPEPGLAPSATLHHVPQLPPPVVVAGAEGRRLVRLELGKEQRDEHGLIGREVGRLEGVGPQLVQAAVAAVLRDLARDEVGRDVWVVRPRIDGLSRS